MSFYTWSVAENETKEACPCGRIFWTSLWSGMRSICGKIDVFREWVRVLDRKSETGSNTIEWEPLIDRRSELDWRHHIFIRHCSRPVRDTRCLDSVSDLSLPRSDASIWNTLSNKRFAMHQDQPAFPWFQARTILPSRSCFHWCLSVSAHVPGDIPSHWLFHWYFPQFAWVQYRLVSIFQQLVQLTNL